MKTIFTSLFVILSMTLFAQSGALDASFNGNGKYRDTKGYNRYGQISFQKVAIQPDGKILMAGNSGAINTNYTTVILERLNADGTLDAGFATEGRLILDLSHPSLPGARTSIGGIAIQPDGKIIVATTTSGDSPIFIDSLQTNNYSDIAVARLNADGSFDATFNSTGKAFLDFSKLVRNPNNTNNTGSETCSGVALRPNGKIVLGGSIFNNKNTSPQYATGDDDALIVQLNANGTLDASFNADGVQFFAKAGTNEDATDIKLQSDGKMVWSGITYAGTTPYDVLVLRTTLAGALDKTFASKGYVQTDIGGNKSDVPYSSAIQADGKILISGYQTITVSSPDSTTGFLLRYQSNGSLDATFGNGGKIMIAKAGEINDGRGVAVQSDGKIIQVGYNYRSVSNYKQFEGIYNYRVSRYNTNGKPDSSFGSFGTTLIDLGEWFPATNFGTDPSPTARYDNAYACAIQPDGKIVVTGKSSLTYYEINGGGAGGSAVRLLSTGTNYAITAPADHSANLTSGCTASFPDIDPKIYPDTSFSIVKYRLYKLNNSNYTLFDSGIGSLSNKPVAVGSYAVLYSSLIDSNQRSTFYLNVTGGTPGTALDFDGVDDRVNMNNGDYAYYVGPNHAYTLETWIKVRGYSAQGSVIFSNQHGNDSGIIIGLSPKGFISTYNKVKGNVISTYKVQLNTWTHIAFVQNAQRLDLYVNGVFAQTLLTAPYLHANVLFNGVRYTKAYFGATTNDDVTFTKFFNGQIDNARLWQRALCQSQLQGSLNCVFPASMNYENGPTWEFTFDRGLAGCQNTGINTLLVSNGSSDQFNATLQNFFLNGPQSNWVEGLHKDTCGQQQTLYINPIADVVLYTQPNACGATATYTTTATSPCPDSLKVTYSINPGSFFPVGNTIVSATAQDASGTTAVTYFSVRVKDTIPPYLQTKDTTIRLNSSSYAYINPTAVIASLTDNCSQQGAPTYNVYPTSFTAAGAYTITVMGYDRNGNSVTKYATVTVLPKSGSFTNDALIASGNTKSLQAGEWTAKVSPNPSRDIFTMNIQGSSNAKLSVTVTDLAGKVLQTFSNVNANQSLQFGSSYRAGTYLAVVRDGKSKKVYKLVKL